MKERMLRLPLKEVPASSAKADNAKEGGGLNTAHLTAARKAIGAKEKRAGNSASYGTAEPASRKSFDPCLEPTF